MTQHLRVLVIGASGRVGRMLRRYWQAAPPRGIALTYQTRQRGEIAWDAADGPDALAAHGPFDRLLVLAGVTPGPGADMAQNELIARACHAAAAQVGAAHMLLASSSAVYGTAQNRPYSEADTPIPTNTYGKAKLDAERSIEGGLPTCALRIGNVLGADALMVNAATASAGNPVHLDRFADGRGPLRTYIGPGTLAQVLETLLHAGDTLPGALNIGAPMPVAMETLLEAHGAPYTARPAPPEAVQRITLNCGALDALHAFDPDASTARHMLDQWAKLGDAP
ncbi:NAD-dependent epimerase/dehydratase family protein [Roseovarius arcticus]|uniref:NAD-dependent epimerase/dehydratase family protein n=1 Tax=Roseovarius arcticus TaxID=2547404 RepID=UPI001487099F|nr:NAD(P)-dependent oxidoreductase [Roseovarius arcticus]